MRNNPLPPAITGDVCRVVVKYLGLTGIFNNTFDYMAGALNVVTSATLQALATAFQAAVEATLQGCLSDQITIDQYIVSCVSLATPATAVVGSGVSGSVAQPCLPNEMGGVIQKTSLLKGQHGRGRVTLPGVPVTFTTPATSPDKLNATGLAAYLLVISKFEMALTAGGQTFTPCIATRPVPPDTLVTHAQPNAQFQEESLLGTARRRKLGRGT